ncbi:Remorin, C-terminal [Dillenia turbinata]|uniref:Remorin, C-terminal n=1 Tax=Dillenia turbinata TaxID=194707 RepID=A0AAN8ZLL1_9MAGN
MTRWSKKHRSRIPGKGSDIVDDWKTRAIEARSSTWDVAETAKNISKFKREEAKITAWENLQMAKAEAAIRKLELRLAQRSAQEMRSSVLATQAHQAARTSPKAVSVRRTRQMGSLSGCLTCHAF